MITGATGNAGTEVIKALNGIGRGLTVYAGVRNPKEAEQKLAGLNVRLLPFDFTDTATFGPALAKCDALFLLRPPQLAGVNQYFAPLIRAAAEAGVTHIVFLSVQGVEKNKFIPHYKIERLIERSGMAYTFLRPAYFMQNFTTTLRSDVVNHKRIFLPAGNAKFVLIDVRDIGAVAARILSNLSAHVNASYELTGSEALTFAQMANVLSNGLGTGIRFESPGLLRFFTVKRKEGVPVSFILDMIMLHYLPRFQKAPALTNWVEQLTGKQPVTFERFVDDHKHLLV